MALYDIQTYLLDRANIHDTITKMSLYADMSKYEELGKEVFNSKIIVDYTQLFGGQPDDMEGHALGMKWKDQISHLDAKHHVTTSILIDLPQPGDGVKVPDKAGFIANAIITLQRKDAKGGPETRNGEKLVRTEGPGNPWRIRLLKVDFVWASGNWDVFNKPL
ncbi:hypothetical protein BDZ45DRAFT_597591 [Acephala macrosclerotiorum]|nr:hypothetical protein BDZ45DRAFT_597591 [Acephala macrosclerotiorum]